MKIGLFGGSFNPVHNGHVRLAQTFLGFLGLDKVFIIPTNIPPHKTNETFASAEDRYEMCLRAFPGEAFSVSRTEIDRGGKSYTIDTIKRFQLDFPDAELFLLVGSDMLLYFDKWYRYDELLKMCTLCAVSRMYSEDYSIMRSYARDVLGDKEDSIVIMQTEPYELSSTEIRELRKKGTDVSGYVPQSVAEYMESRGLYLD
ncbi:MAG: nicotinate (nicotinamide) nucleotide adenylyltransferase [Oscillospiraceae bacterium]|nr:nicotinate (nicotinamide) nucleotide adenylyltransferase [Oscillospiraceae bacterium]